jgi:hypothetical protein
MKKLLLASTALALAVAMTPMTAQAGNVGDVLVSPFVGAADGIEATAALTEEAPVVLKPLAMLTVVGTAPTGAVGHFLNELFSLGN